MEKTSPCIAKMLNISILSLIIFCFIGCSKYADVVTERYGSKYHTRTSFEGGYVFRDSKGKLHILLKFYDKANYAYDTFNLLHLYIKYDETVLTKSANIDAIMAYFFDAQLRDRGFMTVRELNLMEVKSNLFVSGEMFFERKEPVAYNILLSFNDLPLNKVDSLHELLSQSPIIKERFWEDKGEKGVSP